MPDIDLYMIDEVYPTAEEPCQNKAKSVSITQNYYTCHQNSIPDTTYRVTLDTYNNLSTLPYF